MQIGFTEAEQFLRSCEDAVIITHRNPDGDCIGAGFALKDILAEIGVRSRVVCHDKFPKRYEFKTNTGAGEDFEPKNIPLLHKGPMINESITVCGSEYNMTAVSMGNPHAVCFVEDVENLNLEKIGPSFENLEIFPDRVNTEFVKVKSKKELIMRVWERGSGETYACGTGASATAAAAVKNGICDKNTEIGIKLLGGVLKITVDDNYRVFMEGEAKKVYEGVYEFED